MNGPLAREIPLVEVFEVLRSALAALVPVVERLGIPWADGDAYDDWDHIASTLYDQLVVNTCRHAGVFNENQEFAKYDLVYPSYETLAHFEVLSKQTSEVLGVFVGFAGLDRDFTNVKYAVRDSEGAIDSTMTLVALFSDCRIRVRISGAESEYAEVLTMSD